MLRGPIGKPVVQLETEPFFGKKRLGIMVDIWLGILIAEKVAEAESKKVARC